MVAGAQTADIHEGAVGGQERHPGRRSDDRAYLRRAVDQCARGHDRLFAVQVVAGLSEDGQHADRVTGRIAGDVLADGPDTAGSLVAQAGGQTRDAVQVAVAAEVGLGAVQADRVHVQQDLAEARCADVVVLQAQDLRSAQLVKPHHAGHGATPLHQIRRTS